MGGGLTKKGDVVTWELGEKLNNTVIFRLYADLLRAHRGSPAKFHGLLPVFPIDRAIASNCL